MADYSFVDGNVPTATQWNSNVRDQGHTICTSSTRPSSPVEGRLIYETDTLKHLIYVSSAWVEVGKIGAWSTYTPTWSSTGTAPVIGNGTLTGNYQRLHGRIGIMRVQMVAGSTTTFGSGTYKFSMPSGWAGSITYMPGNGVVYDSSSGGVTVVFCVDGGSNTVIPAYGVNYSSTTASSPYTLATGDIIQFTCINELAS